MRKSSSLFRLLGCLAAACFISRPHAQSVKTLSLTDAVQLAQQQSKLLQIDSINLRINASKLKQVSQQALPEFSANASFLRISDNITPFKVAFSTGEVVLNPQILNQSYNNVQARQLIWAGGRVKANRRIVRLEEEALSLELEKNESDVSYYVTSLWYRLYTIQQSKKIIQANIRLLGQQKKDVENAVQQGVVLGSEVFKIDLAITSIESNLVDAVTTQKTLSYNLCTLIGLDTDLVIEVPDQLPLATNPLSALPTAIESSIKDRAELRQMDVRVQQATVAKSIAQSNYLPTLNAGALYNYDRPNQRLFPYKAAFTGTWNVGLFLSWNLTDLYTSKEKVQESKLAITKASAAKQLMEDGVKMEVNEANNEQTQAIEKVRLAEKAFLQAKENFRIEQNRFKANTITATDFLSANNLLVQSELNLAAAKAQANLSLEKLAYTIHSTK